MKVLNRRRVALLCAGLGSVGAVSAFTFGATSAQFTSQADPQTNNITAGTITLTASGSSAATALNIPTMNPGDAYCSDGSIAGHVCPVNGPAGAYQLYYTGTSPAFVGLDAVVTSTSAKPCTVANGAHTGLAASTNSIAPSTVADACKDGLGTLPLFDGDSSAGAVDLVANDGNATGEQIPLLTESALNSAATCSTDPATFVTCTSTVRNLEVAQKSWFWDPTAPFNGVQWAGVPTGGPADSVILHLQAYLPLSAGNEFQGSGASIQLTGHAIQWNNNAGSLAGSVNNGVGAGLLPTCPSISSLTSGGSNTDTYQPSIVAPAVSATVVGGSVASGAGKTYCPLTWS